MKNLKKFNELNETALQSECELQVNEAGMTRIRLDETDFITLVSGGEFDSSEGSGADVKIILADIGYDRMIQIITELKNKSK